ncbi:MAG: stage II sporulation protein P [Syntrophomonadaceae bacterium]|jgi:stage II sporulation protein P|nr:stage II sporulation protein P [Syntrophomonadaceae bacterium]
METINKKYIWIFFLSLIFIMILAFILNYIYGGGINKQPTPYNEAKFSTIKDQEGNIILTTGFPVFPEDEYISGNNTHYIITEVNGDQALASVLKDGENAAPEQSPATSFMSNEAVTAQALKRPMHVVVYHTHSDESYAPTSGTSTKPGEGDIYAVGSAFRETLKNNGVSVSQSYNQHEPHDINAYHRSRRTAVQLLKQQPDAVFDIHRDSAPEGLYKTTVNGQPISRVMIVIGRSNPYQYQNKNFARQVKAIGDELYPGLFLGIFMGKGNYNQDLYPTALLFEIGTEKATLAEAKKGAKCLGDVVMAALNQM